MKAVGVTASVRSILVVAFGVASTVAMADKAWLPKEGTVISWQATQDVNNVYQFLKPTWGSHITTLVAPNVKLSNLKILSSKLNSLNLPIGAGMCYADSWVGTALPVEESRTASQAVYSMQVTNPHKWGPRSTMACRVYLYQDGDNVVACRNSVGYTCSVFGLNSMDDAIFNGLPAGFWYTGADSADSSDATRRGYGIDQLTMVVKEDGETEFSPTLHEVTADLTDEAMLFLGTNVTVEADVAKAFPNNTATNRIVLSPGSSFVFKNPPEGFSFTGRVEGDAGAIRFKSTATSPTEVYYAGCISDRDAFGVESEYDPMPAFTNVYLSTITNVKAQIGGSWAESKWNDVETKHFRNNGMEATAQFNYRSSDKTMLRTLLLRMKQSGNVVLVKSETRSYRWDETGEDYDVLTGTAEGFGLNLATNVNTMSICVGNVTLYCTRPRSVGVNLSGTNATTCNSEIDVSGPIRVQWGTEVYPMPFAGTLRMRDGGSVAFSTGHGSAAGQWDQHIGRILVEKGGILQLLVTDAIDYASWVEGRGGEIYATGDWLLNNCRLRDGTHVYSVTASSDISARMGYFSVGYVSADLFHIVDGSAPSTIDAIIRFSPHEKLKVTTYRLSVADASGDANPDLYLNGAMVDKDSSSYIRDVIKLGVGTVRLGAVNTYAGKTIVSNGVWQLGVNDAMNVEHEVTLVGGSVAVDAGTTNSLGALTMQGAGGGFAIGDGAELSFASIDATGLSGTAYNVITGTLGPKSLRIGTAKCLTDAQLRQFGYNDPSKGRVINVVQDEDGYIQPDRRGTLLIIR